MNYIIKDWANNDVFSGALFDSFDEAEEFLSTHLDETYDVLRGEYEIKTYTGDE